MPQHHTYNSSTVACLSTMLAAASSLNQHNIGNSNTAACLGTLLATATYWLASAEQLEQRCSALPQHECWQPQHRGSPRRSSKHWQHRGLPQHSANSSIVACISMMLAAAAQHLTLHSSSNSIMMACLSTLAENAAWWTHSALMLDKQLGGLSRL